MTQNGVTTTYTYDANNRLLTESKAGDVILYQYDANGNTLRAVRGGDGIGAYTYNLFGNQVSYTPTGVVFTSYAYRPDGLRHSIGNTVHLWDGANIVADIEGNAVTVYVRGLTLLYANDGDETYYHFNAHGDVVVLTNESGTKTKSYTYNAFGVEENPSALDDNPFRYCGEYFDKVNEKIYLRARYYDAKQGRFMQEDPIRDGYNWYIYCENNPIIFIDPTGYAVWECFGDDTDILDSPDMKWMGSGGGAKIISPYDSTSYGNYMVRTKVANYDAILGGYHSNGISSAVANPSYYALNYEPTVRDYQATRKDLNNIDDSSDAVEGTQDISKTDENLTDDMAVSSKKSFDSTENLLKHFEEHGSQFGNKYSSAEEYLEDANYVINNGQYVSELNGYIRFLGNEGRANYAFVGLKNMGNNISTFHIKHVKELSKILSLHFIYK